MEDQFKQPRIAVITALPIEYAAFEVVLQNPRRYDAPGKGSGRRYMIGEIVAAGGGTHQIILSMLVDMGNNISASRSTAVLEHFPTVECIFMVGIAGGAPYPEKAENHVRLGDIVVCDRGGVVQYDNIKTTFDAIEYRYAPRPPDPLFLEAVRYLEASEHRKVIPWHSTIEDVCNALEITRPPEGADILISSQIEGQTVIHPDDPKRKKGWPRVFQGRIASATNLLKNAKQRDQLRDEFGVRAFEMEGSGVADATWSKSREFMIVRGVTDYCDTSKNDVWHPYAAAVAAAYTKTLIESVSVESVQGLSSVHDALPKISPVLVAEATTRDVGEQRSDSQKAEEAMSLLAQCSGGLPESVLGRVLGCSLPDIEEMLSAEITNEEVILNEMQWSVAPKLSAVSKECSISLLTEALEGLLYYVEHHNSSHLSRRQIRSVASLATRCRDAKPELVSKVFYIMNSHLKRTGDKNIVWDMAKLSIEAARSVPGIRPLDVVKNEAVALVCGLCWVYQREGKISLARVHAEESLRLGQAVPWPRNDAFCKKCLGRIYRLEAMETNDISHREELFDKSINSLQEAIREFGSLNDTNKDEEIGDCLSLLGRTYLERKNRDQAEVMIWQALKLLLDNGNKDFLDLQILMGDFYARGNDYDLALSYYSKVIDQHFKDDYEKSSMRARALLKRSWVFTKQKMEGAAQADVEEAREMYDNLKDTLGLAEAEWAWYVVNKKIPKTVIDKLRSEVPLVRTTVVKAYLEEIEGSPETVIAQRSKPTDQEISRKVREARQRIAQEVPART